MSTVLLDDANEILSHAVVDGDTQTETVSGKFFRTKGYESVFGSVLGSDWSAGGGVVESGGELVFSAGGGKWANNAVLTGAAGSAFDVAAEISSLSGSTGQYFSMDDNPHVDGMRWERDGNAWRAIKVVGSSSSVVGSFSAPAGTLGYLRLRYAGTTGIWEKWVIGTDNNWVQIASETFAWAGNAWRARLGGNGDAISFTRIWQVATVTKYHPSTAAVTSTEQTWAIAQNLNTANITFQNPVGTFRVKYRTRGSDGSTWSGWSAFMSLAAFASVGVLANITGIQFQFDANDGGQTTIASVDLISFTIIVVTLTGISPTLAYAGALVSATASGSGFASGPVQSVRLTKTGQADILGTSIVVTSDLQLICLWDLAGAATGVWNVVVQVNGVDYALTNAFTVKATTCTVTMGTSPVTAGIKVQVRLMAEDARLASRYAITQQVLNGQTGADGNVAFALYRAAAMNTGADGKPIKYRWTVPELDIDVSAEVPDQDAANLADIIASN